MHFFTLSILILALAFSARPAEEPPENPVSMTLFDFNTAGEASWQVVNDGVMGAPSHDPIVDHLPGCFVGAFEVKERHRNGVLSGLLSGYPTACECEDQDRKGEEVHGLAGLGGGALTKRPRARSCPALGERRATL